MPSLTPQHRSDEVTWSATRDGLIGGAMALVPSAGAVWLAMKNPKFVKATNWQSRTALAVMPALFMYGFAAESKLTHRMEEVAQETQHSRASVQWAEELAKERNKNSQAFDDEQQIKLTQLYRKSVEESGVRIVPGDSLSLRHQFCNYWQENPFRMLVFMGVPTVGYIFWGRSGQNHLQLQMKVMHTRVMGQFAVITMLLTLMGFKEYMDKNGRYITEREAEDRVQEMHVVRQDLMARLALEKKLKHAQEEEIQKAHDADVMEGHVHHHKKKKHHAKEHSAHVEEAPTLETISHN